jgi:hypothetical protein
MARIARDYGYTLAELRKLEDDLVMSALRVELFFDEEAGNWHYRVPALHINGGGAPLARMPSATACPPSRSRWKATPTTATPTPSPSPSK